jgi:hypothetical protein
LEIDEAIAWGQAAGDMGSWRVCINPQGQPISASDAQGVPFSACFGTRWTRVAFSAQQRKHNYLPPLTRNDPETVALLDASVTISTFVRLVGLRDLGWQMMGPTIGRIVVLAPGRDPIHGADFGKYLAPPLTVDDIRVQTAQYWAKFDVATFPTGDFDVVFVEVGSGEHRAHVPQALATWI